MNEENRFQHSYIQINTDAQPRLKSKLTDGIQENIDALNERYKNKEINVEELLNVLLFLIAKKDELDRFTSFL